MPVNAISPVRLSFVADVTLPINGTSIQISRAGIGAMTQAVVVPQDAPSAGVQWHISTRSKGVLTIGFVAAAVARHFAVLVYNGD